MPANLTPDYLNAVEQYRKAVSVPEKLRALEDMLSNIPKHKGTEKMQADIKGRIAKLKAFKSKKSGAARREIYQIEKQGAAQVILAGAPNSGKSSLLKALTRAAPLIADYPFTTRLPLPGMMNFENIQIQLVDTPPIDPQLMEGWVTSIIRMADLIALVIDLSRDPLSEIEEVKRVLKEHRIFLVGDNWEDSGDPRDYFKRTFILGNKLDQPSARDNLTALKELYREQYPIFAVSAIGNINLEALKTGIFEALRIIRVYSKRPGQKPEYSKPFILKKGSRVKDLAGEIHQDFAHFKFARVWSKNTFDGQRVNREFVLSDQDVVELHL